MFSVQYAHGGSSGAGSGVPKGLKPRAKKNHHQKCGIEDGVKSTQMTKSVWLIMIRTQRSKQITISQ